MWTKLIEIVETRWNESQIPKHRLAKAINTLYGSIHNCHIAFQYFENDRSEQNFANFAFAIDGIISTLKNLHPTLQIFDSELADRLNNYALGADRINAMSNPRYLVTSQIRFLRELVRKESALSDCRKKNSRRLEAPKSGCANSFVRISRWMKFLGSQP
jgi:hypothetical protein